MTKQDKVKEIQKAIAKLFNCKHKRLQIVVNGNILKNVLHIHCNDEGVNIEDTLGRFPFIQSNYFNLKEIKQFKSTLFPY